MSTENTNDKDKVTLLIKMLESGSELNMAVDQVNLILANSKQSLLTETEIEKAVELATREMIRSNDAYLASLKTQLRYASNPSAAVENLQRDTRNQAFPQSSARGKEAANTQVPPSILIKRLDELNKSMEEADRKLKNAVCLLDDHIAKRNADQSSANPKKIATQQSLNEDCRQADSESHDQSEGEFIADEENPSYHPSAKLTEVEKFYRKLNQVADEHSTEIQLGLAYGKYRFWKTIFTSKPGQIIILVILAGICWIFGNDYIAKIILATVITIIVWIILTISVGVIGGAIAGWKNPSGEHERTTVGIVPTLFIWVIVFLSLTFIINKSPEEAAPDMQPVTQEIKPSQAPTPSASTLPEPTPSDPATASPSDESQAAEPSPASDTDQNGSLGANLPTGNVNDSTNPAEKTEKGFQACVRFSGPAYEDCMKPYR